MHIENCFVFVFVLDAIEIQYVQHNFFVHKSDHKSDNKQRMHNMHILDNKKPHWDVISSNCGGESARATGPQSSLNDAYVCCLSTTLRAYSMQRTRGHIQCNRMQFKYI